MAFHKIIPPAKLLKCKSHVVPGQYLITQFSFEVPLDYKAPDGPKLMLYGSSVTKNDRPIVSQTYHPQQRPWMVYNEGGPGYGNSEPESMPLTKAALSRGYQVLYLDYRGTGLSTPVTARLLESKGDAQRQADYLKLFRQDNIVRDLEAVRKVVTADYPEELRQWTIFGHSFGGFVSLTYLSWFPESLREVFISGGLAPIGRTADEVYEATYRKVAERNTAYFNKFPEDRQLLAEIAAFLASNPGASVQLPAGGALTFPRLLTMGLNFGSHGGLDAVHSLLVRITSDLGQVGYISYSTLAIIEKALPFDVAPIYAILHEAIYCDGTASNWAAQRLGEAAEGFAWLAGASDPVAFTQQVASGSGKSADQQPLFRFSGEMIYKMHFETHPELRRMREAADILARFDGWDKLYDEAQLARNEVPVYATSYVDDMYVDAGFARETAAKVKGTKVFETNVLYHNAIRARSEEVFAQLWRLRDDPID